MWKTSVNSVYKLTCLLVLWHYNDRYRQFNNIAITLEITGFTIDKELHVEIPCNRLTVNMESSLVQYITFRLVVNMI